jgi:hypothetical protein
MGRTDEQRRTLILDMTTALATPTYMIGIGRKYRLASLGDHSDRGNDTMVPYAYGMIKDGRVGDALMRLIGLCEQGWAAVVRGIDSSRCLDDLVSILTVHHINHQIVNRNPCLSITALQEALNAEVFSGFDEVWIVAGTPPSFELTDVPCATSDATDFSGGIPLGFTEAMEKTACVLVLGDGCGLNYVTSIERIRDEITQGQ